MDLFLRIERLYHTACDIDLRIARLASALQSLHAGRFEDAHRELYCGDWPSREPPKPEFSGRVFELPAKEPKEPKRPKGKRRKAA